MSIFNDVIFGITFRTYQTRLLERFDAQRTAGDTCFHFLAPPGAGKTILGLEMIRRLGQKAVVLSPNSAIQVQWMQKLRGLTDILTISDDPFSDADIVSLTYQSVSVKDGNNLHENSQAIISAIETRKTIVLDECHHLTSFWAQIIKKLVKEDSYVVGLTATPPIHREQRAINNYMEILGEIDYQIPLPAIVKEGYLAPFQDLVYFTEPADEEMAKLMQTDDSFKEHLDVLMNLDNGITPIHFWAHELLKDTRDKNGQLISFQEMFQEQPDYCIALVRFVKKYLGDVPMSVFPMDEFETELELYDTALLIARYAHEVLNIHESEDGKVLYKKTINALNELGYVPNGRGIQSVQKGAARILSLSSSKLLGVQKILEEEWYSMQEDLRALVLTDYEKGRKSDGTSAFDVMAALTSNSVTDEADPILVTGKTVLVDDDLLDAFLAACWTFIEEHKLAIQLNPVLTDGYYEIQGSGSDWKTKNYIRLITNLFERGVTRCLIGTRSLLGEGWDSIKANTLIDVTTVSTYVSVNQIRGRTLRHDSSNTLKTANNWDVVTFSGNVDKGFLDYDRLVDKHAQFYGISDDLVIEKGIGHLHPLFSNTVKSKVFARRDEINAEMLERSRNRLAVYKGWNVGAPYEGESTISLELIPIEERSTKTYDYQLSSQTEEAVQFYFRKIESQEKRTKSLAYVGAAIGIGALIAAPSIITAAVITGLAGVATAFNSYRKKQYLKLAEKSVTIDSSSESVLKAFALVILKGLQELGELQTSFSDDSIKIIQREDGSSRVLIKGCKNQSLFSTTLAELLGPVFNQKYIVEKKIIKRPANLKLWQKQGNEYTTSGYHPVPEIFSSLRKKADIFKKYWNQYVSPGEVVYARGLKGKELIKQYMGQRLIKVGRKKKEIWF